MEEGLYHNFRGKNVTGPNGRTPRGRRHLWHQGL